MRDEYTGMLMHQMEAGNNGLTKTKYLTFGIHADGMKTAKPRLIHIEMDLLNNFKRLGVQAKTLDGSERLMLMHQIFHMGSDEKFFFDWGLLAPSGLSVKDFIAPTALNFKTGRVFQMGNLYCGMSFLSITASDISDQMLADFLSIESSEVVTMHMQSVDQTEAVKKVKHTITELDRSKMPRRCSRNCRARTSACSFSRFLFSARERPSRNWKTTFSRQTASHRSITATWCGLISSRSRDSCHPCRLRITKSRFSVQ